MKGFIITCLVFHFYSSEAITIGEPTTKNANDPEYMATAWRATEQLNAENPSYSNYYYVPVKVMSANVQVVAGTLTTLQVYYGESNCIRTEVQPHHVYSTNCQVQPSGHLELYEIEDYQRPWENVEKFTIKKIRDVLNDENI